MLCLGAVVVAEAFTGSGRWLPTTALDPARARACSPRPLVTLSMQQKQSIFVDEAEMLREQAFALSPDDMIARSKVFLESRGGFGADPELLAAEFQFMGPVVSCAPR